MKKTIILSCLASLALSSMAQDNLLANKPIYTLGEPKTWTYGEQVEKFNVDDLQKIVAEPANTSNVFLYPEKGDLSADPTNQNVVGIQGFYIDMGASHEVGSVTTTWEGAAADSYVIYLTNEVPTLDILKETPTYSVTGLGQYTENTAVLDPGSKGRYLVFQPTKATNYGWGVKIRSISARAPEEDVLTTFKVSPSILSYGVETEMTFIALNQLGLDISDQIEISCDGDGDYSYADGKLTINSGKTVTLTAVLGDDSLMATVYAAVAPEVPSFPEVKTAVFSNGVNGDNAKVIWSTGYNGGAVNQGQMTFDNGTVAQQFNDTRCVFFSNSLTTGAWNGNIFPAELGYKTLHLDVFGTSDSEFSIEFEGVENLDGGRTYFYNLVPGEWNSIDVDIEGATKLNNLSIRFTEANMSDILLTNIYFAPVYDESDNEAPVFDGEVIATPADDSVVLSFTAADDMSEEVTYNVRIDGTSYNVTKPSGEKVEFTFSGLDGGTDYEAVVLATDGKNVSEKTVSFNTSGQPAPYAASVVLTANGPVDITVDETVKLTAAVYDQYGETMNVKATLIGDNLDANGVFSTEEKGVYPVYAEYAGVESEIIYINVIANGGDRVFPLEYKTYFGDEEITVDTNPFIGQSNTKAIQEWWGEDQGKSFVIDLTNAKGEACYVDLDMLKIHWEAACPKDYTVVLESIDGEKQTVNFEGREFDGSNPVDRIVSSTYNGESGRARINQTGNATSLSKIHKITITPTSRTETGENANYSTKLYGLSLYGTASSGMPTGVNSIGSIDDADDGTVEYYTLQGVKVNGKPAAGIYIVRKGKNTYKRVIR